ncbi:MAG TPA: hypothetical protein VF384_10490 [Planctomycetota bacterium]
MSLLFVRRCGFAFLAGCLSLALAYYLTTLLLVTTCDPYRPTPALVIGVCLQIFACSLVAFFAGRTAFRRAGVAPS